MVKRAKIKRDDDNGSWLLKKQPKISVSSSKQNSSASQKNKFEYTYEKEKEIKKEQKVFKTGNEQEIQNAEKNGAVTEKKSANEGEETTLQKASNQEEKEGNKKIEISEREQVKFNYKLFFKPTILKFALALLMFGVVSLYFLTPILSRAIIIPCKVIEGEDFYSKCPINPAANSVSTVYFSSIFLDYVYQIAYFLGVFIALPYGLACALSFAYRKIISRMS
ncbi:MAG: hypothetical protein QXK37_01220 [Candidatus Woesearchaeota archaeon]